MLSHYLLISLRSLRRTPLASIVNLSTLTVGIYCFLVTYAFVAFWNGADRHFEHADRIYVVTSGVTARDGSFDSGQAPRIPDQAIGYLRGDFPDIEQIARATVLHPEAIVAAEDKVVRASTVAVDPAFLEIFDLPFVAGDPRSALSSPASVVLTRPFAERLFGGENPIGRPVLIEDTLQAAVTGVIDEIPEPSHMGRSASASLRFDVLASYDAVEAVRSGTGNANAAESWINGNAVTYLLLPANGSISPAELRARLAGFPDRHIPSEWQRLSEIRYDAVPMTSLLGSQVEATWFLEGTGVSISAALLLLGGLVLFVACLNYANLATARAAMRTREVGLRKAIGARPSQIAFQHLLEAAISTTAALALAIVAFQLSAPMLNGLVEADLRLTFFAGSRLWLVLLAVLVIVSVLSSGLPAFVLSRARPVPALGGSAQRIGPRRLATLLVGVQFAAAAFLSITVVVIHAQNTELERAGLGVTTDPLLVITNDRRRTGVDPSTLRSELLSVPQVRGVTEMGPFAPWTGFALISVTDSPDGQGRSRSVFSGAVGFDFFSTFDMPVLAGRAFDPDRGEDRSGVAAEAGRSNLRIRNVVVNESFVETLGLGTAENAVGRLMYIPASRPQAVSQPLRIIGVVEDRLFSFFGADTTAMSFGLQQGLRFQIVRIAANDVAGALERIDATWTRLAPSVPVKRRFLDEVFEASYSTFRRINSVFTALAALAIMISTAGLIGMATLAAGRRRKEVAVRKTLGARTARLVLMLLLSFSIPVIVANVAAWPAAYITARQYLDTFVAPISLTPWPFMLCLAATIALAWLAVAAQSVTAARARPADVLRHE